MQLDAAIAMVLAVVVPSAQLRQAGVGADVFPPADHVPAAQAPQLAPPKPGWHTLWNAR